MTMTNVQFQAAFALALSHGHYWAVKAHPAVWEAARIAASYPRWRDGKASTRDRADEAAALAASESRAISREIGVETLADHHAVVAARSASEAVWAAFDAAQNALAAVKAADDEYTNAIGPEGPEDYEAALVIARARDEQGWGGVELELDPSGDVHHTTCSRATSWTITTDGWVTIRRHADDGETVASATVSPGGRAYEIDPGQGSLQDLRRLGECMRALGCERGARNALLLASPAELAKNLGELEARAASAALPSSGWGNPPEYWERHAAPVRDALAVLAAAGQGREVYSAKRAAYLGAS
jgi:hypothetical protein